MNFLYWEYFNAPAGATVVVTLNKQANVLLMTPFNYHAYKSGRSYRYYGGSAKMSPVRLTIPFPGTWYAVVNLDGYVGTVNASAILVP